MYIVQTRWEEINRNALASWMFFLPNADRKALAHACFLQDINFPDDDEYQYDNVVSDGITAHDTANMMDLPVVDNPLID